MKPLIRSAAGIPATISYLTIGIALAPPSLAQTTPDGTLPAVAILEGQILDQRTGGPIPGLKLHANGDNGDECQPVWTDSDGSYLVEVHPALHSRVGRAAPAYSLTVEPASGSPYAEQVLPPVVVDRSRVRHDFTLLHAGRVRGIVRDLTGRPVGGASVILCPDPEESLGQLKLETAADGSFAFNPLIEGSKGISRLYLSAKAAELSLYQVPISVKAYYSPQDSTVVSPRLLKRTTVIAYLTRDGRPVEDLTADALVTPAKTVSLGPEFDSHRSKLLRPGMCSLSVSVPQTKMLGLYFDNGSRIYIPIHPLPGETLVVRLDLAPLTFGTIAGRVTDLAGKAIPKAQVSVFANQEEDVSERTNTNNDGYFSVPGLRTDRKYLVTAVPPPSEFGTEVGKEGVSVLPGKTTQVNLRRDTIPPTLDILTPALGGTVSGMVTVRIRAHDNDDLWFATLSLGSKELDRVDSYAHASRPPYGLQRHTPPGGTFETVFLWDSRSVPDGWTTLTVEADDADGNSCTHQLRLLVKNGVPAIP